MKIIGIGLQKGGVGKTSTTLAIASELAKTSKVLIIDADPQGNATCGLLQDIQYELADVLLGDIEIKNAITKTPFENISMIPTKPIGTRLREYKISGKCVQDIFEIEDNLKKISKYFDYCLIDTSPDFSVFECNLYSSCDEIIPVINCDTFGSDGLTIFLSNLATFKQKRHKNDLIVQTVIINKFNKSMRLDKLIKETVEQSENFNFVTIPQDQNFKESQAVQKLVEGKPETMEAIKKVCELIK